MTIDNFHEEVATKRNRGLQSVLYMMANVMMVVFALMGILRLFQYRKITRNDQSMRKQELAESDERTRMIAERARSWAFSLSITGSGIVVIVLSLLGRHEEALPFAWYVCGMVVLYWISFVIIRKKY